MTTSALAENAVGRSAFLRDRLGSVLAILPLSVWTANHLLDNLAAFNGGSAWQAAVTHHESPFAHLLTVLFVLLPLALHTVWGVRRLFSAKANVVRYTTYANLKYVLQRLSAIGLLLFLGAHLWLAMLHPRIVQGHAETFADIAAHMRHHAPTLVVYVLGVLGVSYHLANGLQTVAMGWGIVSTRRSLKKFEIVVLAIFALLSLMGLGAIFALYQAGASFPTPVD